MTNYERIKSMNIEKLAAKLFDMTSSMPLELPCAVCAGERETPGNYCCADFSDNCIGGVVKWLESEATENNA